MTAPEQSDQKVPYDPERVIRDLSQRFALAVEENAKLNSVVAQLLEERNTANRAADEKAAEAARQGKAA